MLKLDSPELEKLIIQHNGLVNGPPPPSSTNMYPPHPIHRNVTEEQELFAKGFVDQLTHLRSLDAPEVLQPPVNQQPIHTAYKPTYRNLDQPSEEVPYQQCEPPVKIKEEPQCVPEMGQTPPLSPINMQEQEEIKLARKRLRNRVAASKCRVRKLERIAKLEEKVSELKHENSELGGLVGKLREEVCALKREVMDHHNSGCQIMVTPASVY